jgi:hypothetical protein
VELFWGKRKKAEWRVPRDFVRLFWVCRRCSGVSGRAVGDELEEQLAMASVRDVLGAKAAEHPGVMLKRKRWPSTSPQAAAVHPCRCHLRRDQWLGMVLLPQY